MMNIHIDYFSGKAVDLKKSLRNENGVLNALNIDPRVSTWDMSELPWLRRIIASLEKKKLILPTYEPYPWHRWSLTELGKKEITK